ncbi:MAG: glucose 1-dehydrogenase [Dehalococcoidia bacterium]|nr:glucose 1-dehydrogenase [Dehalococcoidia bacterium]
MPAGNCNLGGKVALITGGSRGIGRATALAFARAGADVAVASRKLPDLEAVAEEIRGLGRRSLAAAAHIGKMDDVRSLVDAVRNEFGRIDILVNNAGANPTMAPALDVEERAWDTIMSLNLKGLFFLSQAVAKLMKAQGGGCIINVASVWGFIPGNVPVYSISKSGVIMATKVMAKEWAAYNIRVNAVAPGLLRTRFSEALWNTPEIEQGAASMIPMKRIGEPQDVVGAMLYLASDASAYVTGTVLTADGGQSL